MQKISILLFLPIFILLISAPLVFAHKGNRGREGDDRSRFELRINNQENFDEDEAGFEIGDQDFEISGEVSSLSGNSFTISGQTIVIDPSKVSNFEQKGILKAGSIAKVEGKIINNTKFAREIEIIGTGQGRFKFEIEGLLTTQTSPTASPSSQPSPSPNSQNESTVTTSPTPSPTSTPLPLAQVEIKARGTLQQIIEFIGQVLSFLEGLVP